MKGQTSRVPVRGCSPKNRETHMASSGTSPPMRVAYRLFAGRPLTWVVAHVNEAEGLAGGVQRPLHHRLRGAHEGVDGAVGGGSGVDVQQAATRRAADGRGDGIDHLERTRSRLSRFSLEGPRVRPLFDHYFPSWQVNYPQNLHHSVSLFSTRCFNSTLQFQINASWKVFCFCASVFVFSDILDPCRCASRGISYF